ncbi:hypothetical protein MMC13_007920 [Lambiella insularis]|nr:hypothetical protein [Lambiella insularis]
MAPFDFVPKPPTSPRPPETPPGSPSHTPPNSPHGHGLPRVDTIERLKKTMEKLTKALEKVDATTKHVNAKPKVTKHVEAGKPKTRASKLGYKLVDEV